MDPLIELDRVPQLADGSEPTVSRRGFIMLSLAAAAGAAGVALVDSVRRPAPASTSLTDAQLQQFRADARKAAQEEFEVSQAAQMQARQYSGQFNNAMSQTYNVRGVMMLPGTVYNMVQGSRVPICRNPVFLDTPNQTAATLGEFMQGAYFGTLGPGAVDALVEIVPSRLYDGMVYIPNDPQSDQFVKNVNVRVSAVGVHGFELMAVDDDDKPLVEPDSVSWTLLCVPMP